MSYTELEHGYQGLRFSKPAFYVGDEGREKNLHECTDIGYDSDPCCEEGELFPPLISTNLLQYDKYIFKSNFFIILPCNSGKVE